MYEAPQKCVPDFDANMREKDPIGTMGCRWQNNIKLDITDTWWQGAEWTNVARLDYYSKTCLKRTPYIPKTWTNGK